MVDTYTITLTDGSTTTFNVTNGEDFTVPADGVLYFEGAGVPDGYENSDAPIANAATEISYARYQTLTDAEKTNGTIYMVYDDPTDNYVANNGSYGIDYSLNEQATGKKWINGKPIYQKTFNITPNGYADISALNLDTVVSSDGIIELSNSVFYHLNIYGEENYKAYYETDVDNERINTTVGSNWIATNICVTLRYTKTTD